MTIAQAPTEPGPSSSRRPRVFYGWWVLAAGCGVMGVASGVSSYAATIFFVPVSTALGLSYAATSVATSFARLENSIFAFFVGYSIDRFGPRPAIAFGMSLMGVGLILFGLFANSLLTLVLTWSLMVALGGSIGGFAPIWAALNNWFIRGKGRAMGTGMAAQSMGGLLMAPVLALLIALWDWRTAAVITGIFVLVTAVPLSRVMRTRPSDMGLLPDGDLPILESERPEGATEGPDLEGPPTISFTLKQAVRTPTLWILNLSFGLRQLVQGGVMLHLSPMLQDLGLSSVQAGTMVGLLAFMGIIGAIAIGYLADHFERRLVAAAVVVVESLSLMILFVGGAGWTIWLFVAGYGFAIGVHTLNRVLLGDYFGYTHYARLWGILSVGATPLSIVGPVLAGWVFDTTQSYSIVILVFALADCVAALGYYNCRRPRIPSEHALVASREG
ncbi:MAG: MFS transporter [Chloroflexi bacterium]|nr:MFS transporter [Chloroflexota bacterium]